MTELRLPRGRARRAVLGVLALVIGVLSAGGGVLALPTSNQPGAQSSATTWMNPTTPLLDPPTTAPGPAPSGAQPSTGAVNPVVSVSAASIGHVGSGFAGFSYEKDRLGAGVFDVHDTNLVNLFRLLGPGVLRLGGNLVNVVNWRAGGPGGSAEEIAGSDVAKLAAFLQATGWKAIYGINQQTNTPANAASEAQFAARALGTNLLAFEIGNEPDAYQSESEYESSFTSFVSAIKMEVPNAKFDGPGTYRQASWVGPFAAHQKTNSLAMLSLHVYIGRNRTASIAGMLASNPGGFATEENALAAARAANGIPRWRMTEANSYFEGGTAGVSDVAAAALWSLDFMYGIAAHGGDGVNFHGGTSTQFPLHYSPISFSGVRPSGVQGVYYGELLWKLAGTGSLHTASISGGSRITAWGIGNNVFINNKGASPITANVIFAAPASRASQYLLTAPSLTSTAITIAGSGVGVNGAFNPSPQSVNVSGNKAVVTVPAHSAALILTR